MATRKSKNKKKKAEPFPKITRRLFKLTSEKCRERANYCCEICGTARGTPHPVTGKPQRVEAHHVMSRDNKNSPLKFDLRNLICLCTNHHKTGKYSAHKHGLWFAKEFNSIRPQDAKWILHHSDDIVDLKDRTVLYSIEKVLNGPIPSSK